MFPKRLSCHLFTLVALISLYNLIAFQGPLLGFATTVSDWDRDGVSQIGSLQALQVGLLAAFLLLLSTISIWVMKFVAAVLLMTNAAALYFMHAYGVELDISMIGNILNTNTRQVSELWHWSIWGYMAALGVVPAVLILITRVRSPRWWQRLLSAVGVFVALLGILFATSATWLWYDQHGTRLGARILPWSYIVNTGRHFNKAAMSGREQILLPDAMFLSEPTRKQVVVLVIGEAARADNFGHYGYGRDTTPFTAGLDLAIFPVGFSCATFTIGATACITTHEGSDAPARTGFEPLASYMTRHGVETIWRSNSGGTPPFQATVYERAGDIAARCQGDDDCPDPHLDGALVYKLGETIAATQADRLLVVLHQTGSHGPSYYKKVPEDFTHFTPVCATVQVLKCSRQELFNAYDNTIRYTDYLLADIIGQLEALTDTETVMIYTSDHGQSLGENGFYLHGTPPAIAPDVQRRVPFLVWMSDAFQAARGLTAAGIVTPESHPHDFPFHSVMGAFGMRSEIYKPQFDVFGME